MPLARQFLNRTVAAITLSVAALVLSACVSTNALDQLATATPSGSAFSQALFKNYSFLANSLSRATGDDDDLDPFTLFDNGGGSTDMLAEAFAAKAMIAANGTEVDPEPGFDGESASARDRLLRALSDGKDRFPSDAARAQTTFDCWALNRTVQSQMAASEQCRSQFASALARLEAELRPAPVLPPPPPAATADYTVYFNFDSWTLTGEQLTTLQNAINAARAGRQSSIIVVGHTDTSGSPGYNQALSLKRANVVTETLVDMGARREAIRVSGVGETDLAMPTADGVREPKNRRTVVTLRP